MRMLSIIAGLLLFASCASNQNHENHEAREPASVEPTCKIEKHGSKDWYRLLVNGEPAYSSWYTESQANTHFSKFSKNGKCD